METNETFRMPISTKASTATTSPFSRTISGFTSTETMSSRSMATRDKPMITEINWSLFTADSPRKASRRPCIRKESIMVAAPTSSTGAGRNTTSAITSAITPPIPSITVGPNWGSTSIPAISSRVPLIMGATNRWTSPSAGVAAAKRLVAASVTASALLSRKRTRPRSVLWAMLSPPSFTTTG